MLEVVVINTFSSPRHLLCSAADCFCAEYEVVTSPRCYATVTPWPDPGPQPGASITIMLCNMRYTDTHTAVQVWPSELTDLSHCCYFNFPMNTTNKRMITLCLVPHIVSPPHSTYPEVCSVTTEYLLPGLGWAGMCWAGLGCGANYTIFQI